LKNILLGHTEFGQEIELNTDKFLKQRLLLQGISGSWKTETIKTIIKGLKEVTRSDESPNGIQQIIFDWEGEYHPLRKSFPYILLGDEGEFPVDVEMAEAMAIEIRKTRASVIIDLSSFKDHEERQEYVGIFINAILDVPKDYWKPCTVVIDEAHNLCNQRDSRSLSKKPIIRLCETGRKRSISTILGTQRLAALDKNASAQMVNRLIGWTVEVPDRDAAARLLGGGIEISNAIKDFKGGEYFAFGSALSERDVQKFNVVKQENFEKIDLLQVPPLNNYGQQIFAKISDSLNMSSGNMSSGFKVNPNEKETNYFNPDEVAKLIKNMDKPDYTQLHDDTQLHDTVSDSLADKGRVTLTQSELRKVKLESWNQAFEYILQASAVRKGIFRRKIDVLDIIKVKTKRNEDKYIIKDYQEICKKCNTMLEANEKTVCNRCIADYTERRN